MDILKAFEDGAALPYGFPGALSPTAYNLPPELDYDEWETLCRGFGAWGRGFTNAIQWALADLILYGEQKFGERSYQALEQLGYSKHTLMNVVRVGERFPASRRRALPLTFGHHETLAALPPEEQDDWLDQAERHGWTRQELREAMPTRSQTAIRCLTHVCRRCGEEWGP